MATKQKSPAAQALQKARKLRGLTLEDAATQLSEAAAETGVPGISSSQLSRIETGAAYLTQERLEQLADFYGLAVPDLLVGEVVKAPSRMDILRLKAVVALTHEIVVDLRAKPSPEKMADAVAMAYERETAWVLAQPEMDVQFDPKRHRSFLEAMFRK